MSVARAVGIFWQATLGGIPAGIVDAVLDGTGFLLYAGPTLVRDGPAATVAIRGPLCCAPDALTRLDTPCPLDELRVEIDASKRARGALEGRLRLFAALEDGGTREIPASWGTLRREDAP